MIRRIQFFFVVGSALLVSACGGGSDKAGSAATVLGTTVAPTAAAPVTTATTVPATVATTSTTLPAITTTVAAATTRQPVPTTSTLPAAAHLLAQADIPEYGGLAGFTFKPSTMNGVNYPIAFLMEASRTAGGVQINAGRRYSRFAADLSIPDDELSATRFKVEISLDGSAAIQSYEVGFGETKKIDVDVTNVLRISVTVAKTGGPNSNYAYVGLGNARLS